MQDLDKLSDISESFFGEEDRKYNKSRLQYKLALKCLKYINIQNISKILDCGCGLGEFSDILSENYPDFKNKIICVDGVEMFIKILKEKGYNSFVVNLEKKPLPFDDFEFDLIVCLEVIEHLWNTHFFLSEVKRVLKHGGCAIFSTINYNHWKFRIDICLAILRNLHIKAATKSFFRVNQLEAN